jgi:hypothetical protein
MLATTLTFDFTLNTNEHVKGGSLWTESGPEQDQPRFSGANLECDLESVDRIILSNGRIVKVFWEKSIYGRDGDMSALMKEPRDIALIVTCEGQVLVGKSEPTMDNRIAFTIANEQGKVLYVGMGDLIEVNEPLSHQQLLASIENIYSWRSSSPKACAHCHGSVRKPSGRPDLSTTETPDGGTR